MPKAQKPRHSNGLDSELKAEFDGSSKRRGLARQARQKYGQKDEVEEDYIDSKMSRKILDLARAQQDELDSLSSDEDIAHDLGTDSHGKKDTLNDPYIPRSNVRDVYDDEDEEDEFNGFGDEEVEEIEIDQDDQDLFDQLMPISALPRQSLADMIIERIQEREEAAHKAPDATRTQDAPSLPPKVVEVYTKVGILLSRYKSGKLPKAFKIIPSLRNWEDILYLTLEDLQP